MFPERFWLFYWTVKFSFDCEIVGTVESAGKKVRLCLLGFVSYYKREKHIA